MILQKTIISNVSKRDELEENDSEWTDLGWVVSAVIEQSSFFILLKVLSGFLVLHSQVMCRGLSPTMEVHLIFTSRLLFTVQKGVGVQAQIKGHQSLTQIFII